MNSVDDWPECYPSNWKGLIVPEAMSHPAKYSSRLIRRIYEHAREEGWVERGDTVIDPFGGVALGGLDAMRIGLCWTGVELEAKFVGLGNENIALWNKKFSRMPNWGTARLVQGDSRRLLEVIRNQSAVISVSSPPYAETDLGGGAGILTRDEAMRKTHGMSMKDENYGSESGNLGNLRNSGFDLALSSPPYADSINANDSANDSVARVHRKAAAGMDMNQSRNRGGPNSVLNRPQVYGDADGQLGQMPDEGFNLAVSSPPFLQSEGGTPEPKPGGSIDRALYARHAAGNAKAHGYGRSDGQLSSMGDEGFDLVLSSPPYTGQVQVEKNSDSIDRRKQYEVYKASGGGQNFEAFCRTQDFHSQGYGTSDGNLGGMSTDEGDFDLAVSSAPYENSLSRDFMDAEQRRRVARANGISNAEFVSPIDAGRLKAPDEVYGETAGQLGNDSGDSFWLAARAIVDQVFCALKPGGHAIWVVKAYVKNKSLIDFPDQWRQLCEAAGFVTLHEHRASLVHSRSYTLEGEIVEKKSASFFRRLAEKKGSPRIDYETVWCMVRP